MGVSSSTARLRAGSVCHRRSRCCSRRPEDSVTMLRLFRTWRLRLRSLLRKETVDTELHHELLFHFDELVAAKIADGLSPADARAFAHRTFGNIGALEESCRDERRVTWVQDLRQDIVYGLRILRARPGFTVI